MESIQSQVGLSFKYPEIFDNFLVKISSTFAPLKDFSGIKIMYLVKFFLEEDGIGVKTAEGYTDSLYPLCEC